MSLASQLSFLESSTSTIQQINNNIVIAAGANASSTTTGALQIVNGGLAVGGGVFVGGTVTATSFVGTFAGTVSGTATTATNIAAGTAGQIHYQTAPGLTGFAGPGSYGQFLMSTGASAPVYQSTLTQVNGNIIITSNTGASSTITGALQVVNGGVGIGGNLYVGDFIQVYSGNNTYKLRLQSSGAGLRQLNLGVDDSTSKTFIDTTYSTTGAYPLQIRSGGTSIAEFSSTQLVLPTTTSVSSTNTGALQVAGGIGVAGGGFFGGIVTATTFVGTFNGTIGAGTTITTATNIAAGTAGQLHYQSAPGITAFAGPGTAGQLLVSAGTSAPTYTNTGSIGVGFVSNLLTAGTGLTGTAYNGSVAQTWTLNTATLVATAVTALTVSGTVTTATNIAAGTAGQLPYQSAPSVTSFVGPGTFGQFLMSTGANAPVYQSTLTQAGGNIIITSNTAATSTTTGALQVVNGGVGIGGNLYVGGEIVATKLTIQLTTVTTTLVQTDDIISTYNYTNATSTTTGALQVAGGAGIGRDLYVGGNITVLGTINASITGVSTTATNIAGGTAGQLHYQTGPGATSFVSTATTGNFLQANYVGAPTWTSTGSIYVNRATIADTATTATNAGTAYATIASHSAGTGLTGSAFNGSAAQTWTLNTATLMQTSVNVVGGAAGSLVYQTDAGATTTLALGTNGYVLTAGASAPAWTALSGVTSGNATNAANVATVAQPASGTYYPTFVNANNASSANMAVYTTSSHSINPSNGYMMIGTGTPGAPISFTDATGLKIQLNANAANYYAIEKQAAVNGGDSLFKYNAGNTAAGEHGFYSGGALKFLVDANSNAIMGQGGNLVIRGSSTVSAEGAQIVLGYGNNQAASITGQANYTWNIDVAAGTANNNLRIFRQNSAGATVQAIIASEADGGVQLLSLGVGTAGSGTTGEIRATNEITAYYSDRRLKENVAVIDNAVEKVLSLHGITYTPNDIAASFGYDKTVKLVGLFADEVEAVLPEATRPAPFDQDENGNSKSGENYKTIQYEKVVPLLVEAIKEQQATIKTLLSELEDIKKQLGK